VNGPEETFVAREAGGLWATWYAAGGPCEQAAVFCHPILEERKSAHRLMVEAARALAAAGVGVLRFDYRGCGDSEGEFRDFGPRDWQADVGAMLDLARRRSGGRRVGLLGVRLGASLAVASAMRRPDVGFVVLWQPVLKGRTYLEDELRRKLVREMVTFGKSRASQAGLRCDLDEGRDVDLDGYAISRRLYDGLSELDLAAVRGPGRPDALVVSVTPHGRADRGAAELGEVLTRSGCAATVRALRGEPFWSLVGYVDGSALIRETLAWLRDRPVPA
jgi:exosortase A-associated hydrolase 2